MALSRRSFWEQFFEQRVTPPDPNVQSEAGEWFVSDDISIIFRASVLFEPHSSSNGTICFNFRYIGVEKSLTVCAKRLAARNRATTRILHNGCGSSELGVALSQRGSPYGFQLVSKGKRTIMYKCLLSL
jgi:hypothetical protein